VAALTPTTPVVKHVSMLAANVSMSAAVKHVSS